MRAWIAGALTVTLAAFEGGAAGLATGALDATLRSSSGDEVRLSLWRGRPVILFYEDKDSTALNVRLKDELFKRGRASGLLDAVSVVPVANLEAFDFFPARGAALKAVREEERKAGVPILVDLDGTLGGPPWNLPKETSTVLLLDAEGKLIFKHAGPLGEAELESFFGSLEWLLGMEQGEEARP